MIDFDLIQSWLSTGADGAQVVLAYFIFKIERRVFKLELKKGK